jgi:hypothetical protein
MERLATFFLLTYALTWTCFISVAILTRGAAIGIGGSTLLLVGTFAPSLVALFLTYRNEGSIGITTLLGRMFQWRVGMRWYVFAVGFLPAIKPAVAITHRALTGAWPPFGHESPFIIAIAIVLSAPVQAGEEIGWRGYALPRLAARVGFAWASVLLGAIWGIWHLPLFILP